MSSEYERRKKRYADAIIQRINDNPQAYLDMDSPSERRGRFAKARPSRTVRYSGRDLAHHLPDRTDSFRIPLRMTFGTADDHRAVFELIACTPNRLLEGVADGQFVLGHGLLIVGGYDSARLQEVIRHRWKNTLLA